jgi:hypothetical protein
VTIIDRTDTIYMEDVRDFLKKEHENNRSPGLVSFVNDFFCVITEKTGCGHPLMILNK